MLLVPTRIGPSTIHGMGVFTLERISSNAVVWRFTPGFDLEMDPQMLASQPEHIQEWLLHYGYIDPRLGRFILCCDNARFLNHSDAPNLCSDFGCDRFGVDVAARDIATGEELTIDYRLVEGQALSEDAAG